MANVRCSLLFSGEFGSVVSGQLNVTRMDVMAGSQSVTIKMLTGTHVHIHILYMYSTRALLATVIIYTCTIG